MTGGRSLTALSGVTPQYGHGFGQTVDSIGATRLNRVTSGLQIQLRRWSRMSRSMDSARMYALSFDQHNSS